MYEYVNLCLNTSYMYLSYGIGKRNINCDILFASAFSFIKHMMKKDELTAQNVNNALIFKT